MAAEDKQTAQVYKFTALNKADNTPGRLLKDLGPGGYNPEGNAVQPNAFEPEDEYQRRRDPRPRHRPAALCAADPRPPEPREQHPRPLH